MKHRRFNPSPRALSIAAQIATLKSLFPQGIVKSRGNALAWEGVLSPLDCSREYRVRLNYEMGASPSVMVLSPNLHDLAEGRRLPHCYDQAQQRLCLFYPWERNWTPHIALAQSVMKWALAWLVFFEIWLSTDVWHGRAIGHPGDDPSIRSN
jgi:hypothetical protein